MELIYMELTKEQIIFLEELLGHIDYHLLEHILKDSNIKQNIDIHSVCTKLYCDFHRELGN